MGLQQGAKQFIDAILKVNHLPLDYTEVVVGYDPESLVQGACDAFLCYVTNEPLELAVRKIPYVVTRFDQLGYVTYASALFCRRDYLTANRATVLGYMRALQRGWAAAIKDPHAAAQLAVNTYGAALGLDIRQQLAISTVQIPLLEGPATQAHGLMWMDKQRVAGPIYTTLRASGRTNLPPVDRVVDMAIIDALNHHA